MRSQISTSKTLKRKEYCHYFNKDNSCEDSKLMRKLQLFYLTYSNGKWLNSLLMTRFLLNDFFNILWYIQCKTFFLLGDENRLMNMEKDLRNVE